MYSPDVSENGLETLIDSECRKTTAGITEPVDFRVFKNRLLYDTRLQCKVALIVIGRWTKNYDILKSAPNRFIR